MIVTQEDQIEEAVSLIRAGKIVTCKDGSLAEKISRELSVEWIDPVKYIKGEPNSSTEAECTG